MNKLLIVSFISLSGYIFGQGSILKFTAGDSIQVKYDKIFDEYIAKGFIKNISAAPVKVAWKRTYISTSDSCTSAICDYNHCYAEWVNFSPKVIALKSNDSAYVDLHLNTQCCEPNPTSLRMDYYLSDDTSKSLVQVHYKCGVITKIDYLEGPEFSIQPNPASDVLQVKLLDYSAEPFSYEIVSLAGVSMHKANLSGVTTEIALDGLPAGIYFLRLRQGLKATEPRKFVVAPEWK